MKKGVMMMLAVLMAGFVFGGEFELETESFSSFRTAGNFRVNLVKGTKEKIQVFNRDEDLLDERIICEVKEGELSIRIKGDTYMDRDMEITVIYVDLTEVTAKMGSHIEVKNTLKGDEIELTCESGGKIKAAVICKNLKTEISAGGSIHVEGESEVATYKISAGGTIGAVRLAAKEVNAVVTAGGEVICRAEEDLSIKITSGGSVSYLGDPEGFEQNITLGGKITKLKDSDQIPIE